jgi:hypothetical protein
VRNNFLILGLHLNVPTHVCTWIGTYIYIYKGDQVGRIFVLLWAVIENYINSPKFGSTILHCNSYVCINFDKKHGLGYILVDFFTHSSGHPEMYICTCVVLSSAEKYSSSEPRREYFKTKFKIRALQKWRQKKVFFSEVFRATCVLAFNRLG